ncbi:hypothetical protein ACWEFJ_37890 [Actinosynnema sp. NPDC004786]
MTDLDLPPTSPLPDGVRAVALTRLRAGFDAPPPRRLPLKVAAVAVAVVAAAALAVRFTAPGDQAATASSTTAIPELRHHDAHVFYDVREGSAPAGMARRCQARSAALPPPERWTAIATASQRRVDLAAFETTAGIVFCETTPMSVTVSSPQADPGALAVAFTTTTGSMAGFTGADPRPLLLSARTGDQGERVIVARSGRVFLMPNGFVSDGVVARPEVSSSDELVQGFELTTPPPAATAVDRPVTPEDRTGPEGRRLGECLADQPRPVPDADAWRAGRAVALTPTESVQLGHYGDLLLLCRQDRTVVVYDLARPDAPQWAGMLVSGGTLRGARVFYDFGHDGSNTEALIAEVTDPRVASVTLVRPGLPDTTAVPVAGSVVVPGLGDGARFVVRDAAGTVLEEITPGS